VRKVPRIFGEKKKKELYTFCGASKPRLEREKRGKGEREGRYQSSPKGGEGLIFPQTLRTKRDSPGNRVKEEGKKGGWYKLLEFPSSDKTKGPGQVHSEEL